MPPSSGKLPEPQATEPAKSWKHYDLYQRVKGAVLSLPIHFRTETYIEGISATDIFTLNSALGATIEDQVVATLNRMRTAWDPGNAYSLYGFVRQPQTFPDVLLRRFSPDSPETENIILGIELKGWYLLSKEGEPSFRYVITPAACANADLLVCVPWALKNVLSGSPEVFPPFVKPARHAAELRNYHWQYTRKTKDDTGIISPTSDVHPYPHKSDKTADKAKVDGGKNFGRYARTGIMDEFIQSTLQLSLCGIPASAWLEFFKSFTESGSKEDVLAKIKSLREKWKVSARPAGQAVPDSLLAILDILENSIAD